jgi:tol-pal system protein YbgF
MKMKSKMVSISAVALAAVTLVTAVWADVAPVVNATPTGTTPVAAPTMQLAVNAPTASALPTIAEPAVGAASSLTTLQRLTQLEQQMKNFTAMNMPQEISDLQNQVQQLRGQLQVQSHDLKLLNSQQRSFYQDVDSQITQLKNLVSNGGSVDNPSVAPAKPKKTKPASTRSSTPKAKAPVSVSSTDTSAYQAAFELVAKKQFNAAIGAFNAYLNQYSNGRYVANAHYWLGEIYAQQKKVGKAELEFTTVVTQYPKSNKVADSRLKIAMIHASAGKIAEARQEFQAVEKSYPGSTAAQLAGIQLQQLSLN